MRRLPAVFALLIVLSPLTAFAQQDRPMMPKGRWWKMPEVAKRLSLTPEQQEKLDAVFTKRSKELIDLKAEMEKSAIELRASLEKFGSSSTDVLGHATAVGNARGMLFRKEIEMMLDIRAELTEEQWTKLRTAIDQQIENRFRDSRRPAARPNPPPPQNRE